MHERRCLGLCFAVVPKSPFRPSGRGAGPTAGLEGESANLLARAAVLDDDFPAPASARDVAGSGAMAASGEVGTLAATAVAARIPASRFGLHRGLLSSATAHP